MCTHGCHQHHGSSELLDGLGLDDDPPVSHRGCRPTLLCWVPLVSASALTCAELQCTARGPSVKGLLFKERPGHHSCMSSGQGLLWGIWSSASRCPLSLRS